MERTATPARAKAAGNSQASQPTATAPVVDFTELDATIIQESGEAIPAHQRIADRFGEPAMTRSAGELLLQPNLQVFDERFGECPTFS